MFKKFLNKKFSIPGIIILIIITALIIRKTSTTKQPNFDYITATKTNVIQEVSVTGKIKPLTSVELAFEQNGKVESTLVDIGSIVQIETPLINLDNSVLNTELAQAEAKLLNAHAQEKSAQANIQSAHAQLKQTDISIEIEKIKFDELKKGAREEEIKIAQTTVDNAQKSLDDAINSHKQIKTLSETKLKNAKLTKEDAIKNLQNIETLAKIELENLYAQIEDILNDAYAKADDAITKQIDSLFIQNISETLLSFSISNSDLINEVRLKKNIADSNLIDLKNDIENLSPINEERLATLKTTESKLSETRDFLAILLKAINDSFGLSTEQINEYKSNVNIARTNMITAIKNINDQTQLIDSQTSNNQKNITSAKITLTEADNNLEFTKVNNINELNNAQIKINNAENTLSSSKDELDLTEAGTRNEKIKAQEELLNRAKADKLKYQAELNQAIANRDAQKAQILEFEAAIKNLESKIDKNVLKSPIVGIVTKQDAKVGEIVSTGKIIIEIISVSEFEIESNVPEVDIAKININDQARITLDAYDLDTIFLAKVTKIDPAETIIEGVSTYKITLEFYEEDQRIKSGMTANIDIESDKKENVIAVPQRSVIRKEGTKIIRVLTKTNEIIEKNVQTGLRGSDGNIEITKGINENDKVIIFTEE